MLKDWVLEDRGIVLRRLVHHQSIHQVCVSRCGVIVCRPEPECVRFGGVESVYCDSTGEPGVPSAMSSETNDVFSGCSW